MGEIPQLKLGAFMRPSSIHTGAWRYPGPLPDSNFNFSALRRFAQRSDTPCTIAPDLQQQMAKRSGAKTIEIAGGHLLQMSHPDEVTALIEEAAKSTD